MPKDEFKIVVNATEHIVTTEMMTYEQVLQLAFPGHPNDPNISFLVTFEHAASKPHAGTLAAGGQVTIKNNTAFDVTQTNRS